MLSRLVWILLMVKEASCFVNLAHTPMQKLQGVAIMSEPPQYHTWTPDKAVDGNINQTYSGHSCAIMEFSNHYQLVWWKVQLEREFNIAYLEVYFRSDTIQRTSGFSFYIYKTNPNFDPNKPDRNNLFYHHDPMSGCPASVQNITVNRVGQEIVFFNQRLPGYQTNCTGDTNYTAVEICEVKVMGCDADRYSLGCNLVCPAKCRDRHCDVFNGTCKYGCSNAHLEAPGCGVCEDGYYSSSCTARCGHCVNGESCDKQTGHCHNGCQDHFQPPFCQDCGDGFYNSSCTARCGHCLNGESCDKRTGTCTKGCDHHFLYPLCIECKDGYYDKDCATNCGKCEESTMCDKTYGYCLSGCRPNFHPPFCKECNIGFHGDECDLACDYCNKSSPACRQKDGHCLHGCERDIDLPQCRATISQLGDGKGSARIDNDGTSNIGLYILLGILAVALAISLGVIIMQRRKISAQETGPTKIPEIQRHRETGNYNNPNNTEDGHEYTTLDVTRQESRYHVISTS